MVINSSSQHCQHRWEYFISTICIFINMCIIRTISGRWLAAWFLMNFQMPYLLFCHPPAFFCIYLSFIFTHFPDQIPGTLLSLSLLLPETATLAIVRFASLISTMTPGYVLIPEDMGLEASVREKHTLFVFLDTSLNVIASSSLIYWQSSRFHFSFIS